MSETCQKEGSRTCDRVAANSTAMNGLLHPLKCAYSCPIVACGNTAEGLMSRTRQDCSPRKRCAADRGTAQGLTMCIDKPREELRVASSLDSVADTAEMPPKPKPPKPKNRQQRSRRRRAKPLRPAPAADASKSATTVPPAAAGICISRSPTKKEFILHVEAASACPLKKDAKKVQAEGQSATGSSPPYVNSAIAFILGGNEDLSDTDSDWDDDSDCGGTPDFPLDVLVMPLLNSFLSVSALADSRPTAQRRNGDQVDGRLPVSPLVQDANEKWNQMYHEDVGKTPRAAKVNFPLGDMLVQVHTADDFERKGPWEQIAVDRRRFQSRIASMECVLAPVLCAEHRQNVYRKIYASAATE